jgi:hypothetical protein
VEPPPHPARATAAPNRAGTLTLLVVLFVSLAYVMWSNHLNTLVRAGVLIAATGAFLALLFITQFRRALTMGMVLVASSLLLVVAVASPPRESNDLWSYAIYGRVLEHYHANPYTHPPDEFWTDVTFQRVGTTWRHTESVYGPLFTAVSAGITRTTNDQPLSTRLAFQGLAALAVFLSLLILEAHTRDPATVALVGLNPVVIYAVVNSGHNDALVGLGLLAGVLLAKRQRWAWAGFVIALAVLVKIVAGLALAALVVWAWRQRGRRPAVVIAAVSGATIAISYLAAGGPAALRPLGDARSHLSRSSIWQLVRPSGLAHLAGLADLPSSGPLTTQVIATGSSILVVALAGVFVSSRLRDPTPTLVMASALVAYLLAAAYLLPWYSMWVLPILALQWRSGLARVVLAQSLLMMIAYQYRHGFPSALPYKTLWFSDPALLAFELVAIVALVVAAYRRWKVEPRALPDAPAEMPV